MQDSVVMVSASSGLAKCEKINIFVPLSLFLSKVGKINFEKYELGKNEMRKYKFQDNYN